MNKTLQCFNRERAESVGVGAGDEKFWNALDVFLVTEPWQRGCLGSVKISIGI